jgi:hypothetical protein
MIPNTKPKIQANYTLRRLTEFDSQGYGLVGARVLSPDKLHKQNLETLLWQSSSKFGIIPPYLDQKNPDIVEKFFQHYAVDEISGVTDPQMDQVSVMLTGPQGDCVFLSFEKELKA